MEPTCQKYDDGHEEWRLYGKLHREGGPAHTGSDGSESWWVHGKLHREDGPAVTGSDGYEAWHLNDKWHREDGPAVIHADGSTEWLLNGKYHREDGPAVILRVGNSRFSQDNTRPALNFDIASNICADGSKEWWYLSGKQVEPFTQEQLPLVELSIVEL